MNLMAEFETGFWRDLDMLMAIQTSRLVCRIAGAVFSLAQHGFSVGYT